MNILSSVRRAFLAALLMIFIGASSFAGSLNVDSFSVGQGPLTATGSTGPLAIGNGISRTLSLTSLGGLSPVRHTTQVTNGVLDMTNGVGDDSAVVVSYDLPMLGVPTGATNLAIVLTMLQTDGNATEVLLGGIGFGFANIPGNTANVEYRFGINGPPVGPGNLVLMFGGDKGWDAAVDGVKLTWSDVPEPSTYAMVGAGLIGLAFGRRRHSA